MIPPANEYKVTDTYSAEEAMERLRAFVARRPSYPDHAVIAHESHADMIRMGHLRALASVRPEARLAWVPIEQAPLAIWGFLWNPIWRRPFPGMRNGDNGAAWVDTCEPEAQGWQTFATHWSPLPPLPQSGEQPISTKGD